MALPYGMQSAPYWFTNQADAQATLDAHVAHDDSEARVAFYLTQEVEGDRWCVEVVAEGSFDPIAWLKPVVWKKQQELQSFDEPEATQRYLRGL